MSISRRSMVASSAALAVQAAQTSRPADMQDTRGPVQRRVLQSRISDIPLLPREKWRPYPTASDRDGWLALSSDLRERILQRGEEALKGEWTFLPASVFL